MFIFIVKSTEGIDIEVVKNFKWPGKNRSFLSLQDTANELIHSENYSIPLGLNQYSPNTTNESDSKDAVSSIDEISEKK